MKKYFIPDKKNDYRPHLLRKSGIAALSVIALGIFAVGVFQNFIFTHTDFLGSVLPPVLADLANTDRQTSDLPSLTVSPILTEVAQDKANDMAAKGYFAHTSPSGQTPWYWFSKDGYTFSSAGENLAINFTDSGDVNSAWMNSPEHRANILDGKFTQIGIATAEGMYEGRDTVFVVQEFGKPYSGPAIAKVPTSKSQASAGNLAAKPAAAVSTTSTNSTNTVLGASIIDTVATSPRQAISLAYEILAALVILAIALMIGVEVKRQKPKNVIAGILLLAFIILLMYLYQRLSGSVVVL